jgi:glutamate-1-semialdehyde 2,1-aminomutase
VNPLIALAAVAAAVCLGLRLWRRFQLSLAKCRSLEGHPRWSRRLARQLPFYEYDDSRYFRTDDAPAEVEMQRRRAFAELGALFQKRNARGAAFDEAAAAVLSDLQFTARYRVPFQFSRRARETLKVGAFVTGTHGMTITDVDGNEAIDLTGSYGVNVFGNDFYKGCIERGAASVCKLGPVLGSYHPLILDNVRRLRSISGMDEVSFHMSGTEAVMQAVRLARYHTGRRFVVRFAGAYHGWWGDVQPGAGNPMPARDTYTLQDMSRRALGILRQRRDIACVLVNPLQALHPNLGAPSDSSLVDGGRWAHFDRAGYSVWLAELRAVCDETGVALILDEVFMGFRIAPRGAQEYFGVKADLVTYGKTVAGGLPIGVVAGRSHWMRRYNPERPADICFARGTFNTHPYVMGAMNEFLLALDTDAIQALYRGLDATWDARAAVLNARLAAVDVPVRVANLSTVWTVLYTQPGRYHWMFQYYLRAHGLALSWIGTGRLIFTLLCTDAEFAEVVRRFEAAARTMRADGWWWRNESVDRPALRRQVIYELLQARFSAGIGSSSSPRNR